MNKRLLLIFGLVCATMSAQVDTGVIVGTLQDSSGAVIPNATITLAEKSTNTITTVHVDGQGNYVFPALHVGTYSVSAEAAGFQSQTRTDVTIQVQDRRRVDFVMTIGQVSANLTVTDEAPALQTETSALGQVIGSATITAIPLNGRDYVQLATLSPGVVSTNTGTNGNTGGTSTGGQSSFAANGSRGTLNNFLLDGIDNNSNDTGGFILRTSVDAIEEFKIQTNSFSAQFGRSGGATVNATIKSGSNSYHGSAFEFLRNSALDARDYFEDPSAKKASFKQNQFGATIGGPILRNKLFWFGDYQGTTIRNPMTLISTVPDALQRTGVFDPGKAKIYDPSTYDPITKTRTQFADNKIPSGRIDPIALQILNLYPLPNQPGKSKNNYLITPVAADLVNQGDFRGDYNKSDINHLFFRWSMSGRTAYNPQPLPGLAGGGGSSTGYGFENTMGASLGETHTFSPRTLNEFRIGFNHVAIRRGVPVGGNVVPPSNLLVPGVPQNPDTSGITLFKPSGGYRRIGSPGYAPTILSSEERQITNVVNMVRGKHTIAAGAEIRWSEYNIFQVPAPNGSFSFTGQFTQNPIDGSGGSSLADELLGLPVSSTITTSMKLRNRQYTPSVFIQDDFKLSNRLTLNLGARYDYFSPFVERYDHQSNFDYATGTLIAAGQNGASRSLVTPDHLNFVPRVGFAWNVFNQTVVSSAYGIFFSGQEIRTAAPLQLAYNAPFYYQSYFTSDGITPSLTVSGGFPAFSAANAINPTVTSVDSRLHTPYYQEWNLSVQQGLSSSTSLEVSYAGSKGTHLQSLTDQNQVRIPGPGDVQSRRPYPNFGPFSSIQNRGSSTYHSAQVKVEKRYSKDLSFLSSFTWGKVLNDQPEICCAQPFPQNSYNVGAEKGPADFDQRIRWVSSFDYLFPIGRGQKYLSTNRFADLVLGGWHVSGIYALASGFYFSPQLGYDPSNTGDQGLVRPNRVANGNLSRDKRTPDLWFDPNAFPFPDQYTYGNAGRNILVGPGTNTFDGSMRKVFRVTEAQNLELRGEFFNMLNHPNFTQPDPFIDDGPGATGVITSTGIPNRQVQIGLKYRF
jgi:hypothetical protein